MSAQTYVPVTVELASPASPAVTFSTIAPIDLTSIFRGWGPMPAVVSVDNQPESWDRPGLMRTPRFSDGGSATERLTEYSAPHSFAYELTAFTNMLQFLVQRVRGEWTISPYGSGSMVRWTYAFYPKAGRAWLVRAVLAPIWRRYATQVIDAAVKAAASKPV